MDERLANLIAALCGDEVTDETRTASLSELDDTQLGETEADLLAHFQAIRAGDVEGIEPDDLGELRKVAAAVDHLRDEAGRRYEAAAAVEAEAVARAEEAAEIEASLLAEPKAEDDPKPDVEVDVDVEITPAEPAPDPDPKPEPVQQVEEILEPVSAAAAPAPRRPSLAELAAARPQALAPQTPAITRPRWESINPKEPIRDMNEAAERIVAAAEMLQGTAPGVTFKMPVVRVFADYPDEMMLKEGDVRGNTRKAMELTEGTSSPERWDRPELEPIVAAGGWCAPPMPRYDVMTIANAHRPFRDGLPRAGAERGAITVVRGLGIEGVTTGGPTTANASVGIWTADTDEAPGENVKGRDTIDCPTPVTCELQAIYTHRKIGNLMGRSWPELIAAETKRTMAAQARVAETELLDCVCDASLTITEAAVLGSSRDLLVAFRQAKAQIVNRQRIAGGLIEETRVRLWLPHWVPAMMVADINRQQASGELGALEVTESTVLGWIRAQGINVGLYVDSTTGGSGIWGDIADNTSLRNWPTTVQWMMHPEGTFLFLDGGTLDLGVYRDGNLIGTNDYAIFSETFEQCCFIGIPDTAICVTHTVCPNGESQVATDETGSVCSGS